MSELLEYKRQLHTNILYSDPPLEEDDIPTGEWLCNECKSHPLEVCKHELLSFLKIGLFPIKQGTGFSPELQCICGLLRGKKRQI